MNDNATGWLGQPLLMGGERPIAARALSRRRLLALGGAGLAAMAASACASTAPSATAPSGQPAAAPSSASAPAAAPTPRETLRLRLGLAYTPVSALPLSVLWLAKDLGFYEREGLDVELLEMPGTPTVVTAMLTEDIDVGNIATEDVIKLTATRTLDLRAIHSPDPRLYFIITSRDNVSTVRDLAGRAFGISRVGSLDHSMSTLVLQASGVNPADVRFVPIGAPTGRGQALVAGQIDATAFSIATYKAIQREPGVKILVGVDQYYALAPVVQKVDAVPLKVLREKPEHLRRFTTAVLKTARHFAENRQAWVEAMRQRRPDIDPNDLDELWDQFTTSWPVNGAVQLGAYAETADFIYRSEAFKDVPRIELPEWLDVQILDSVLGEIGVYSRFDDPGRPIG